ncbi:MAG: hypothetical protein AMXMBFR23_19230 [Chloroflexota bacterium]
MSDTTRRPRPLNRALPAIAGLLAVGSLALGVWGVRALTGGEDAPTPAATTAEALLVFAEFGPDADRLYLASPATPEQRTLVATIEHATGWGINPAHGTAGHLVAYTVLPPGVPAERDTPAELWVLDLATGEGTRLAQDADLLVAPLFEEDGRVLLYRRSTGTLQELVRVVIEERTRAMVHAEQTTFGIFPIGYDADGALLFARLSTAGTDVLAVEAGGEPALRFHASDHIARDWRISPDRRWLSYLAPEPALERIVHRARVVALDGGADAPLAAPSASGEQYGPTWTPDGRALTVGQEAEAADAAAATTLSVEGHDAAALAAPEQGFDVPVAWSPDGRYLAARTFDGVNSVDTGTERAVIIGTDGTRRPVDATTEVILIGWYVHA